MANSILSPNDIYGLACDITRAQTEAQRLSYQEGWNAGYRKGVEEATELAVKQIDKLTQQIIKSKL